MHASRLLCLWICVVSAGAQQAAPGPPKPFIRTSAGGVYYARPDQVQVDIGVTTQAQTAQAAAAQNAKQLEVALAELKKALGPQAEIQTVSYAVNPNFRYPKEGGRPAIDGYTVVNIVRVRTGQLAEIGKVIDAATQSGANTIHGIQFMLKDEQAARAEALRAATLKARAQAEAIAAALGVKLARLLSAEEGEAPPVRPMREIQALRMAEQAAPTPVEPGAIEVHATITLTFEVH